jgi:uncharacterized protein (DUF433 family)
MLLGAISSKRAVFLVLLLNSEARLPYPMRCEMHANEFIECDPEKLGGTPVFVGTRVPIQNLFDCLANGESLDEFLDQFPTVSREQALRVLEASKEKLLADYARATR